MKRHSISVLDVDNDYILDETELHNNIEYEKQMNIGTATDGEKAGKRGGGLMETMG